MNNERDPAQRGRDMDAEAVASRSGAPIEHAKDAVEKTGSAGKDAEKAAADARQQNSSPPER